MLLKTTRQTSGLLLILHRVVIRMIPKYIEPKYFTAKKEQKYYDIILKRVADFNKNFEPKTLFDQDY